MDNTFGLGLSGNSRSGHFTCEKSNLRVSPIAKKSPTFAKSPSLCETPVRERRLSKIFEDEVYTPGTRPLNPSVSLANLPIHTTPPSRLKNFTVHNPFDETLRKKLHLPLISPTLFTKTMSPSQDTENFSWSIEDLANLFPAEIDEFQVQNDKSCDEQTEQEVQKSINRYFDSNIIVPSPWGNYDACKQVAMFGLTCTPVKRPDVDYGKTVQIDLEGDKENFFPVIVTKEAWTQTELTLPPEVLPPFVSLGAPFLAEKELNKCVEDTAYVEKSSLSSVQCEPTCSSPCYKPFKNLLSSTIHTPKEKITRSFGTPLGRPSLMSPIGLSPIVCTLQYFEVSRDSIDVHQCSCDSHKDFSFDSGLSSTVSQTDLTFPNVLPKRIEEFLKPFHTFTEEQSEMEDANLNSSLSRRRKLLFNENLDMSVSSIKSTDNGYDSS